MGSRSKERRKDAAKIFEVLIRNGERVTKPTPANPVPPIPSPFGFPPGFAMSAARTEAEYKEYSRINSGILNSLGSLVLFTDPIPAHETSHWSVVSVKSITDVPDGCVAGRPMSDNSRMRLFTFTYKAGIPPCASYVFARVEKGKK